MITLGHLNHVYVKIYTNYSIKTIMNTNFPGVFSTLLFYLFKSYFKNEKWKNYRRVFMDNWVVFVAVVMGETEFLGEIIYKI